MTEAAKRVPSTFRMLKFRWQSFARAPIGSKGEDDGHSVAMSTLSKLRP
jgi:hypothetical protein